MRDEQQRQVKIELLSFWSVRRWVSHFFLIACFLWWSKAATQTVECSHALSCNCVGSKYSIVQWNNARILLSKQSSTTRACCAQVSCIWVHICNLPTHRWLWFCVIRICQKCNKLSNHFSQTLHPKAPGTCVLSHMSRGLVWFLFQEPWMLAITIKLNFLSNSNCASFYFDFEYLTEP